MKWHLQHVKIENFKCIKQASIPISTGFTVITGPNGSGKSCVLESVAFGLGENLNRLRVTNLREISGNNDIEKRVQVILTFICESADTVRVGSSIIDGSRIYTINNAKVQKKKFLQIIKETLKFGDNSSSWHIGQKAVHDIVKLPIHSCAEHFSKTFFHVFHRSMPLQKNCLNQFVLLPEQLLVCCIYFVVVIVFFV